MNKAQKILVLKWIVMLVLFIFILLLEDWITEHLLILRVIASLILLFISFTEDHDKQTAAFYCQKIADENPWIKLYLFVYCIFVFYHLFSIDASSDHSDISKFVVLMLLLFFPFIFVSQRDKYRSLK